MPSTLTAEQRAEIRAIKDELAELVATMTTLSDTIPHLPRLQDREKARHAVVLLADRVADLGFRYLAVKYPD